MKKFSFEIKSTEMRIAEATLKKINRWEEKIAALSDEELKKKPMNLGKDIILANLMIL